MKYEAHYAASEGGKIEGETEQYRKAGDAYEAVTAVSYPGYRFIGWSDGVTEPTRQDVSTEEGVDCEALFEEIKIHFTVAANCRQVFLFPSLPRSISQSSPPKKKTIVYGIGRGKISRTFPFFQKRTRMMF